MSTNPYEPPTADVSLGDVPRRGSLAWAWFFWIMLVLTVLSIASMPLIPRITLAWYDWLDAVISLVSLAGIYGLAYGRAIGRYRYWRGIFWLAVLWSMAMGWVIPFGLNLPVYGELYSYDWTFIFQFALMSIYLWGLYLYGYRRDAIWLR